MTWCLQIPWPRWLGGQPPRASAQAACWRRGPLSHPALQAMTQRELGDLPFDPRAVADE